MATPSEETPFGITEDQIKTQTYDEIVKQAGSLYYPSIVSPIITGGKASFGKGNNCFKFDEQYGLWSGHQLYSSAPFKVSLSGTVTGGTAVFTQYFQKTTDNLDDVLDGTTFLKIVGVNLGNKITDTSVSNVNIGKLTAGSITSKAITLEVTDGSGDSKIQSGKTDFTNTENGFILGVDDSDSDRAKFYIGDSLNYINWDGVNLLIVGSQPQKKFIGYYNDDFTVTVANASITRRLVNSRMSNATGGYWYLKSPALAYKNIAATANDWNNNYDMRCRLASDSGTADAGGLAGASMFWGLLVSSESISDSLGNNGTVFATVAEERHIGFFVGRDNKLYSSNADGTNQTINEIAGITFTNENDYRIVFTSGVSAKFYVNNVLVATHTTNLPSGATNPPVMTFGGFVGINTGNLIDFLLYNNYEITII